MYENHYSKWWIYLTHWGLLACTLQSWLAAIIVTSGTMVDRDDFGKLNLINKKIENKLICFGKIPERQRQNKASYINRLYWILYTIATVYSFIITICYWTIVHDPGNSSIVNPHINFNY